MAESETSALPRAYPGSATLYRVARVFLLLLPLAIVLDRAYQDVVISAVAVFFVIHSAMARDWRWARARWVQAALVFWLYVCLRNLIGANWGPVGLVMVWVRFPVFAAALFYWLLPDRSTQRWMVGGLLAMLVFILGDTLLQYMLHHDLFGRVPFPAPNDVVRLTGPFVKPRVGITIAWFALPLLLPLARVEAGRPVLRHMLAFGLLILALMDVYLSGERMALLLLLAGLAVSALIYRPSRRAMSGVLLGGVLLCAGFSFFKPDLFTRQWDSTQTILSHFAESSYGKPWAAAVHVARGAPLWGVGHKHFQAACLANPPAPDDLNVRCPMHPHNIYLETLAESGVVGLGLLGLMVAFMARDLWRSRRFWPFDALLAGLVATLLLRLWPVVTSASFQAAWAFIPFWWYWGWFYYIFTRTRSALDEPGRFV